MNQLEPGRTYNLEGMSCDECIDGTRFFQLARLKSSLVDFIREETLKNGIWLVFSNVYLGTLYRTRIPNREYSWMVGADSIESSIIISKSIDAEVHRSEKVRNFLIEMQRLIDEGRIEPKRALDYKKILNEVAKPEYMISN